MTETEIGGVLLTVEGLSTLAATAVLAGLTLGAIFVLVTLFYGRRS